MGSGGGESGDLADRLERGLFVLQVPWLPTGKTLGQVIERIRGQRGSRRIRTAQDVARVVLNSQRPVRRKA